MDKWSEDSRGFLWAYAGNLLNSLQTHMLGAVKNAVGCPLRCSCWCTSLPTSPSHTGNSMVLHELNILSGVMAWQHTIADNSPFSLSHPKRLITDLVCKLFAETTNQHSSQLPKMRGMTLCCTVFLQRDLHDYRKSQQQDCILVAPLQGLTEDGWHSNFCLLRHAGESGVTAISQHLSQ